MKSFFKKFTGDSTRGRPCKECGHVEISHHLKVLEVEHAKPYNNKAIRANCKECDCKQFQ